MIAPACCALQHRLGDLRRVRQMADARLDDFHTGRREPFLNLLLHVLGDFGRVCRAATCRLRDERRMCSSWQGSERPPPSAPSRSSGSRPRRKTASAVSTTLHTDDSCNLDRIAVAIVHLQPGALEVPHALRDAPLRVEGFAHRSPGLFTVPT